MSRKLECYIYVYRAACGCNKFITENYDDVKFNSTVVWQVFGARKPALAILMQCSLELKFITTRNQSRNALNYGNK